ncbi:MAG: hypothetical protein DMF24_06740 [Verrucomicrobia bacterium]|nr:MAG: hypothetical protein DMF24_06740 [Verrucomicrobiota bacterium]
MIGEADPPKFSTETQTNFRAVSRLPRRSPRLAGLSCRRLSEDGGFDGKQLGEGGCFAGNFYPHYLLNPWFKLRLRQSRFVYAAAQFDGAAPGSPRRIRPVADSG